MVRALAIAAFLAACGARTPLETGEGDGGNDAGMSPDAGDAAAADAGVCAPLRADGGVCNDLSATGAPVAVVCDTSSPPAPRGGAIADGVYRLVASRFYGVCPAAESDRITWSICGGAWATVQEVTIGGGTTTQHIDGDAVVSGTQIAFRARCGTPVPVTTFDYDATPTTLTIHVRAFGPETPRVDSFVRQ